MDGSGNIFVADEANDSIRKITPSGTNWIVATIAGGASGNRDGTNRTAQFSGPSGVAVDTNGRVFVADQFNNTIRLLAPVGTNWVVSTIAANPSPAARRDRHRRPIRCSGQCGGGHHNNVYVADFFNNAVRK